jgi:hypothetical protein
MTSVSDVYDQMVQANANLQQIDSDVVHVKVSTDAVKTAVEQGLTQVVSTLSTGFATLSQELQQLLTLEKFADLALAHIAKQNDTIICILEHISQQTCATLNEAHTQTGLQTALQESISTLLELYQTTHAEAALAFERQEGLRKQLLECCPPEASPPLCTFEPCEAPPPLGEPPSVGEGENQPPK